MTKNPPTSEVDLVSVLEPENWERAGFTERVRAATAIYVKSGMSYPLAAYLYYVVRMALFVGGWMFFCSFTPGLGTFSNFTRLRFSAGITVDAGDKPSTSNWEDPSTGLTSRCMWSWLNAKTTSPAFTLSA